MKAGVLAVIALGAIVWGFALIGILSIAQAIGPSAVSTPAPLLAHVTATNEPVRIASLPAFPGATLSESEQDLFGTELVTEIEYLVDSTTHQVRGHYRETLARYGWTVTESAWTSGGWTFAVSLGDRHGLVAIVQRSGVTEVEIEIAEPSPVRGGLTDR